MDTKSFCCCCDWPLGGISFGGSFQVWSWALRSPVVPFPRGWPAQPSSRGERTACVSNMGWAGHCSQSSRNQSGGLDGIPEVQELPESILLLPWVIRQGVGPGHLYGKTGHCSPLEPLLLGMWSGENHLPETVGKVWSSWSSPGFLPQRNLGVDAF